MTLSKLSAIFQANLTRTISKYQEISKFNVIKSQVYVSTYMLICQLASNYLYFLPFLADRPVRHIRYYGSGQASWWDWRWGRGCRWGRRSRRDPGRTPQRFLRQRRNPSHRTNLQWKVSPKLNLLTKFAAIYSRNASRK